MRPFETAPGEASKWWFPRFARDGGGTADAAELLEAAGPSEALATRAGAELAEVLPDEDPEAVGILAGVLAGVRDRGGSLFRTVGRTRREDARSALLPQSAFRRLVDGADARERMSLLRLAARLAGGNADVRLLAADVLGWGAETRARWIAEYHGAYDRFGRP